MAAGMEKTKEEFEVALSLETELICSICLCLFKEPVSLSCSHSFCKQCIQQALRVQRQAQTPLTCPMCKLCLGPNLELQKNFHLSNIVQAFQAATSKVKQQQQEEEEGSEEGEAEVFPCEYCLDEPQPAVKTCLMCDASLCQAHLSRHNARAAHREHVLVQVAAGGTEERRCPEHGRLRECYCSCQGVYVCPLCCIWGEHRGHRVSTMKEGHDKQLAKLWNAVTWLQEYKSALVTTIEELQKSETQLQTNTKTMISQLQKLFDETKTEIIQKEKKFLSDLRSNEEKQVAEIAKVKKEMEQRREEVEQNLQSLQKMREQEDIFLFFKEFKLAKERKMFIAEMKSKGFSLQQHSLGCALVTLLQLRPCEQPLAAEDCESEFEHCQGRRGGCADESQQDCPLPRPDTVLHGGTGQYPGDCARETDQPNFLDQHKTKLKDKRVTELNKIFDSHMARRKKER